ncbi:putative Ig domain-containing protein [Terrabacter sp. GCM10028922]|uniref:putative Ig domain-containing protein n=1 Tax=Terrabacter sp. GCM10028922 TaxID=3273428 RepID=UPI00360BC9B6
MTRTADSPSTRFAGRRVRRALAAVAGALLLTGTAVQAPWAGAAGATTALAPAAAPATAAAGETCAVQITEHVSSAGFTHPGVGLTKPVLENARAQVAAQAEPWFTYYTSMTTSSAASRTATSSNRSSSNPTLPASTAFNSQGFNSRFIADGLKAYTQALMWVLTGEKVYRQNALAIIRIWEQMDPNGYVYFTDSHIHTGIPLNRMATAAEILRYSSCDDGTAPWTDADTTAFTNNLVTPVTETFQHANNYFMNQHNYPLLGAMAGYIFTDNRARYDEAVEWFTVNKTADDQGFNGSVSRLFRWVDRNDKTGEPIADPHVQHMEMGRDQAHGGGDLTNSAIISRMLLAQGTKVDPTTGTVSTRSDAVGPYEFLDDRILAAADYFWSFMLGNDTEWTPVAYAISPDGTIRDTYNHISGSYRGRYNTTNFWDLFYYYTYVRHEDLSKKAPHFYEAFTKRQPQSFYYGGSPNNNWDNVDGGGDFWLYVPEAAQAEGARYLPPAQTDPNVQQIEQRYHELAGTVSTLTEGQTSFVRLGATTTGSKIAFLNGLNSRKVIGFRVRTDGPAVLTLAPGVSQPLVLPDTGGEWRYVTVQLGEADGIGDLLFITAKGAGAGVDLDAMNLAAGTQLTPPVFRSGTTQMRTIAVAGALRTVDLSATDTDPAAHLAYGAAALPAGAALDAATGQLTWRPSATGSATATVWVSDGTTVAAKRLVLEAVRDRKSAVAAASHGFDPKVYYVAATRDAFEKARADALKAASRATDAAFQDALDALLVATAGLERLTPTSPVDGSFDYPATVASSTMGTKVFSMVDGDDQTGTSYGQAVNLSHTLDFGPDFRVSARKFGFQSNIFADRLANSAVFGSNDKRTWTRLTPGVTAYTQDYNTLDVADDLVDDQFRFIKVQLLKPQPDVLYGIVRNLFEINEFHIFGERHEVDNLLESVSLGSDAAIASKISLGDTARVTVTAREPIQNVRVAIQGVAATVRSTDGVHWTADAVMRDVPVGEVSFSVDYDSADGTPGPTAYVPSDGSRLFVAGDAARRIDVASQATVTASAPQWPGTGLGADEVGDLLFDRDGTTFGDLTTGAGSYYVVDLGAGRSLDLDEVVLLPRPGFASRLNGMVVQGSNDGTTWADLTAPVAGASEGTWYDVPASAMLRDGSFRYLRLVNQSSWNGNVAEVELYGALTSSTTTSGASATS